MAERLIEGWVFARAWDPVRDIYSSVQVDILVDDVNWKTDPDGKDEPEDCDLIEWRVTVTENPAYLQVFRNTAQQQPWRDEILAVGSYTFPATGPIQRVDSVGRMVVEVAP